LGVIRMEQLGEEIQGYLSGIPSYSDTHNEILFVLCITAVSLLLGWWANNEEVSGYPLQKFKKATPPIGLGELRSQGHTMEPVLSANDEEVFRDFARLYQSMACIMIYSPDAEPPLQPVLTKADPPLPDLGHLTASEQAAAVLEHFEEALLRRMKAAGCEVSLEAGSVERLVRRVTVDASMSFAIQMDISPPVLHQPCYVISAGAFGLYVSLFAFVGDVLGGARPDEKHTQWYLKIVSQNLAHADDEPQWMYSAHPTKFKRIVECVREGFLIDD